MDLSDRLPIWLPPRNPSTFLAPLRCSAAKGAWVRVERLPLETPPPRHERSTVTHSHEDWEKVAKQWWDIYHCKWENGGACPNCERFLTFRTIAFYLGFLQDGSWLLRWEPRVINKAWPKNLLSFSFFFQPLLSFIPPPPLSRPSQNLLRPAPRCFLFQQYDLSFVWIWIRIAGI